MAPLMGSGVAAPGDQRAARALARLVGVTVDNYLDAARATARHASVGNVHALRVCTRRLRAALGLCTGSVAPRLLRRARRPLRRPFRRAGRLRDLHVAGRLIARQGRATGAATPLGPGLVRKQRRHARRLRAALGRRRLRRSTRRLAAVTTALQARARTPAAARGTTARLDRQLRRLQAALAVAAASASRDPAPAVLHRARLALKRFRYSAELAARLPGLPPLPDARALRSLQQRLGRAADFAVAARVAPATLGWSLEQARRRAVAEAVPLLARWQRPGRDASRGLDTPA